jgi:hypothetical protein
VSKPFSDLLEPLLELEAFEQGLRRISQMSLELGDVRVAILQVRK